MAAIRASGARRVLDLGCGEGKLLRELLKDKQFEEVVGMDVSIRSLETARDRLKLDRMPERQAARIKLIHGSLIYRDRRLEGFDAAAVVEVVEHLDPPRLSAFERVLFEFARPGTVVLTTPNREYNVTWENVGAEQVPPPRPPLRVDPAGVPGLGRGRRRAVRLHRPVPAGRAGGRGARAADADGGLHPHGMRGRRHGHRRTAAARRGGAEGLRHRLRAVGHPLGTGSRRATGSSKTCGATASIWSSFSWRSRRRSASPCPTNPRTPSSRRCSPDKASASPTSPNWSISCRGRGRPTGRVGVGRRSRRRRHLPSRSPNWTGGGSVEPTDGQRLFEPLEAAGPVPQYRRRSDGMRCLLIPSASVEIGCDSPDALRRRAAPARGRDRLVPDRRRAGVHHGLLPVPQLGRRGRPGSPRRLVRARPGGRPQRAHARRARRARSGDRCRAPSGGR